MVKNKYKTQTIQFSSNEFPLDKYIDNDITELVVQLNNKILCNKILNDSINLEKLNIIGRTFPSLKYRYNSNRNTNININLIECFLDVNSYSIKKLNVKD